MKTILERIAWYKAERYLARYKPYGIAVAGTYGRTITSDAILHALKSHRHVRNGYIVEHSIDIPESILGAKSHKEHGNILEMLTRSKMREITHFEPDTIITQLPLIAPGAAPWALSRILPRMLVLTHIGLERLDLFVNKETIIHEYLALAKSLHSDAVVVLNVDDASIREVIKDIKVPVITYGVHPKADIRISRATRHETNKGLFLEVTVHGKSHELFLPSLFAKQHVSAVAAGIAAAHGLGISVQDAIDGIRVMKPPKGTLLRIDGKNGVVIIDDSYETCPEQIESSLKTVATLPCSGKKIVVVGDMDDLGSLAIYQHEEVGKHVATVASVGIFVGDMMRHAQEAALKSGHGIDTHHFSSSSEAAAWLPEHVREGDMVFVSGGKSMQMGKVIQSLKVIR